jgi:uncharacterized caspase-like protein
MMAIGRLRSRLLVLALFCLAVSGPAHADKRVALIIGNSAYRSAPPLNNPEHDAELMAKALTSAGFIVSVETNVDGVRFREALAEFGKKLQDADVGFFYYAGHGLQVGGKNYLVPIDASPLKEADVELFMINADVVLGQMQQAGTNLNIIVLDACRNFPFGTGISRGRDSDAVRFRSLDTGGLAEMRVPAGTLIAFSTQPGNVALDGADRYSPFAMALVETIRKPGLDLFTVFNNVQTYVHSATHGVQVPWFSTNLIPPFYFIPPTGANNSGARISSTPAAAAGPSEAERAWAFVKDTSSQAVLEDFIRHFGDTFYASLARERLAQLKQKDPTLPLR